MLVMWPLALPIGLQKKKPPHPRIPAVVAFLRQK
jgi:hypothetical protein